METYACIHIVAGIVAGNSIVVLKSMEIEPNLETVVTFIAGNLIGATILTSVPNEGGIEKMAERIPDVVEVLKRRIPEMMAVFQSATQQ